MNPITVSQLGAYLKKIMRTDPLLSETTVIGELSSATVTQRGFTYFTIKDAEATLSCVMFKAQEDVDMRNSIGMELVVTGSVQVFPPQSRYQLVAQSIVLKQQGLLYAKLEQLKRKLSEEGLFATERKRAIPAKPHRIGLITSDRGAAVADMIQVIRRRSPMTHIRVYPTQVQGEAAAAQMVEAIRRFNEMDDLSTVIIGRGGGSFEDLFCFNDEHLVRAVAASRHPIISAVGHEVDTTLVDYAADVRAATPTAAAELATTDISVLRNEIDGLQSFLKRYLSSYRREETDRLNWLQEKLLRLSPRMRLSHSQTELTHLEAAMRRAVRDRYRDEVTQWKQFSVRLQASNPLSILKRGYAIVSQEGHALTDAESIRLTTPVDIQFYSGSALAWVHQIQEDKEVDGI